MLTNFGYIFWSVTFCLFTLFDKNPLIKCQSILFIFSLTCTFPLLYKSPSFSSASNWLLLDATYFAMLSPGAYQHGTTTVRRRSSTCPTRSCCTAPTSSRAWAGCCEERPGASSSPSGQPRKYTVFGHINIVICPLSGPITTICIQRELPLAVERKRKYFCSTPPIC